MIYFCADDYGVGEVCNKRIEDCLGGKLLNKISVLPNGEIENFKECLQEGYPKLSLHLNLVEGYPLSARRDVDLIVNENGSFKYSFIGLFLLSFAPNRSKYEKQIYCEIKNQIEFWKKNTGDRPIFIDSHQHTHMIPFVFKLLLRAIRETETKVEYLRIPAEPIMPYLSTASLYFKYSLSGIVKQWLLKILWIFGRKSFKKSKIKTALFMGAMFSGKVDSQRLLKMLPKYLKLAERKNYDIEIGFHPAYLEKGEKLMGGCREDFKKFYASPWRKTEYETLMNFKFQK